MRCTCQLSSRYAPAFAVWCSAIHITHHCYPKPQNSKFLSLSGSASVTWFIASQNYGTPKLAHWEDTMLVTFLPTHQLANIPLITGNLPNFVTMDGGGDSNMNHFPRGSSKQESFLCKSFPIAGHFSLPSATGESGALSSIFRPDVMTAWLVITYYRDVKYP